MRTVTSTVDDTLWSLCYLYSAASTDLSIHIPRVEFVATPSAYDTVD